MRVAENLLFNEGRRTASIFSVNTRASVCMCERVRTDNLLRFTADTNRELKSSPHQFQRKIQFHRTAAR